MKKVFQSGVAVFVVLGLFLSLYSCAVSRQNDAAAKANSPVKAWIGMSEDELHSVFPGIAADQNTTGRYTREALEFGLQGTWQYSFTDGKLRWFIFNAYNETIDEPSFNACLSATETIIQTYRTVLGEPAKVRTGIHEFNDPSVKMHNGYLVQQASWSTGQGTVKVDFSFLGENKSYQFLVSVQVSA